MKKTKLCYRFHDPNPAAVTADYLLTILIEANKEKVAQAIRERSSDLYGRHTKASINPPEYNILMFS